MKSEMCLHATYKWSLFEFNVFLGQSNVQRVWFGSAVPTSYTVTPGKSVSVHLLTRLPRSRHQP